MPVVASYTYTDPDGNPIARIDRIEPGRDGKAKEFLPHLSDGAGGFAAKPGLGDVRLPLYHRDELLGSRSGVGFLVEGEGKCDALRAALQAAGSDAIVVTVSGGASAPLRPEHVADFAHMRQVVVLADSDDPGRSAADTRAQRIADANPAVTVRVGDLYPEMNDHRDVADWLAAGHTIGELRELSKGFRRVEARLEVQPPDSSSDGVLTFDDLARRCTDTTDWFIDGLLRRSGVLLMAAQPKVGKSDTARNLAKAVAQGGTFLGRQCRQGKVLWIGLEEPVSHLHERVEIMGMHTLDIAYAVEQPFGDESAWLRSIVERHKPSLVVVDTIGRFSNLENINDYSQVRRATQPMLDLRTAHGVTFVLLHHNNRANGTLGSIMWDGFVDCIMSITRNDDGTRFAQTKQRSGTDMEPTVLTMDEATGTIDCVEPAFVADRRIAEQRILAHLRQTQCASREELARNCGRRASIGRSAVDALIASGLLKTTGDGTKNSPRLYSLCNSPDSSSKKIGLLYDDESEEPAASGSTVTRC